MSKEKSILLNAEAFGFGPAAAIAAFFPYLRQQFSRIGYAGTGHSLDLQRALLYDEIHDLGEGKVSFKEIVADYDVFLTALNFERAATAAQAGVKTIIYDPLAWYWPALPAMDSENTLYVAQDFHGVRERLNAQQDSFPTYEIVPSIVAPVTPARVKDHILINLGGLQNPYWPAETTASYARLVLEACRNAMPPDTRVVIAGNSRIAAELQDMGPWAPRVYSRAEMETLLPTCRAAIMTPGLGNIYDAAACNLPTLFLPPANDSQGQQLRLMQQHGMIDGQVDWPDVTGHALDYKAPQNQVMQQIAANIMAIGETPALRQKFNQALGHQLQNVMGQNDSRTAQLIERFGQNGAARVAELVVDFAQQPARPCAAPLYEQRRFG